MKYSYRIFSVFGISVELHITFIFFLLLVSMLGLANMVFWLSIFAVVLMHELTHSLVAMSLNIDVPKIMLTPIGGLASIEVPEDPKKELLISIAGPLSNFVLAAIIYMVFVFTPLDPISYGIVLEQLSTGSANITDPTFILSGMLWVNLILGLFNIVPGFPMDGGRVFRAVLALWMDYLKATKNAVRLGQLISFFMVIIGLFSNFWLVLIGVFLYYAGNSELQLVKIKHALRGLKIGAIAVKDMHHVNESTTITQFLKLIAQPNQNHYPVSDYNDKVIGILNVQDIKELNKTDIDTLTVRDITRRHFDVIDANLNAEETIGKLLSKEFWLVVDSGKSIGYLTPQRLFEAANFYSLIGKKQIIQATV